MGEGPQVYIVDIYQRIRFSNRVGAMKPFLNDKDTANRLAFAKEYKK